MKKNETIENKISKQALENCKKEFSKVFDMPVQTNPILKKFVKFSEIKPKFTIKGFLFK